MTRRRRLLQGLGAAGLPMLLPANGWGQAAAPAVTIAVDTQRSLRPVNPLLLGNNLDWAHNAQAMYLENSQTMAPGFIELADRLAPTALRFPGGTNADFYRWKLGIGPLAQRGKGKNLAGDTELHTLGTDEFLALCKRWGATPLITVNLATASAQEAADWVAYTNKRQTDLPRVRHWEIGNEPYLEEHTPEAKMSPAEYARRANLFIQAMKAVDPNIACGIALRSDTLGGVPATPFPGFNNTVLAAVTQPYEFVALHSSYYPVTPKKEESPEAMYLATMAGTRVMEADAQATRAALARRHGPNHRIQLAFTEVNALYSVDILRFGMAAVFLSSTDRYIESMAAALYIADALRAFSLMDDLLMANYWSLSGNWWFGAIGHDMRPRPQFHVLEAYRQLCRGDLLPCSVNTPGFATAKAGFVPAFSDTPQVAAHAVRQDGVVRVAVINRHPNQSARIRLQLPGGGRGQVKLRELLSDGVFAREVRWAESSHPLSGGRAELNLQPHSFAVLTLPPV